MWAPGKSQHLHTTDLYSLHQQGLPREELACPKLRRWGHITSAGQRCLCQDTSLNSRCESSKLVSVIFSAVQLQGLASCLFFFFSCGNSWKSSKSLAKCYLAELPAYQVEKILQDQTALRASCQKLLLRATCKTQCWWLWTWPLVLLLSQCNTRIITYT